MSQPHGKVESFPLNFFCRVELQAGLRAGFRAFDVTMSGELEGIDIHVCSQHGVGNVAMAV